MSDKRDDTHKLAVLEFLYATAARSVGHVALAMVEMNGDHDGAQRVLDNPVTREGFAESVSKQLRASCGDVTIPDATVGQLADAAKAAANAAEAQARGAFGDSARPRIVVLSEAGPTKAPDAAHGSSDFGAN